MLIWGSSRDPMCCNGIICNSYSIIKTLNRWDQPDLDIVLVNGDALHKILRRQTLLTAEDLPRKFDLGDDKVYPHFKENRYGIFDSGVSGANTDLLDNLVTNSDNQTTGPNSLFKACVLQLYHTVQIITFLNRIVLIAWVRQVKMVIRLCYSLSQLNIEFHYHNRFN